MTKKEVGKKVSTKTILGIGAGVAAISAAVYVLFGPQGKKNRKIIRGWSVKMKGEIIEKFENVKELTEPVYHDIISRVESKYAKLKNIDKEELSKVVSEIKKQWGVIKKTASKKIKK